MDNSSRSGRLEAEELNIINGDAEQISADETEELTTILKTQYRATTNRMLRVAVNGFMESLGVVLGVMAELDVDVLDGVKLDKWANEGVLNPLA